MYKLIIPLALLAVPTIAVADGCNPNMQNCGSYKDAPAAAYSYSYSIKQSRGSWECPPELARWECRRIKTVVEKRRARDHRPRPAKRYVERRIPVIRDVDGSSRPRRAQFGGKRCLSRVEVAGVSRPTEGLARGNAWKRWRETVRSAYGEQYMDNTFAVGERMRCHIASSGGWTKRCTVSAVPCR